MTIQIEILNPDARKLLDELAKLNLIRIRDLEDPKTRFSQLLKKLRDNNASDIDLDKISDEIEQVREKRYKDDQSNKK